MLLGDVELCSRNYQAAEAGYRQQGQLGRLAQVLVSHAAASVFRGLFQEARDAADEAIAFSRTGQDFPLSRPGPHGCGDQVLRSAFR